MFRVHKCIFVVLESTRKKRTAVNSRDKYNVISGKTKHARYHRSIDTETSGKKTILSTPNI